MKSHEFESQLQSLSREPFHPFEVIFQDGRVLAVDRPFTVGGGVAGFLNDAGEFIRFGCEEIALFRPASVRQRGISNGTESMPGMSLMEFEESLRTRLRAVPFRPFDVELLDGRIIHIQRRKVAFCGGGASHVQPGLRIVEFWHHEVRSIRETAREKAS